MKTQRENKKFNKKRQDIVELAKKYLDTSGIVDMTRFRKEQSSAYSRLAYYFNGVNGLLEAIAPPSKYSQTEEETTLHEEDDVNQEENDHVEDEVKRSTGRGCPINAQSVRNELAYDMLRLMRKNMTFQEIGDIYGVSRAHIHQLVQILERNLVTEERQVTLEKLM